MFLSAIEQVVRQSLYFLIMLLEIYGSFIIIVAAHKFFFFFLKTTKDGTEARLNLARYLAFGLEFLLAAEIVRTITVRHWEELQILAAILAIRAILAILINYEIKQEKLL